MLHILKNSTVSCCVVGSMNMSPQDNSPDVVQAEIGNTEPPSSLASDPVRAFPSEPTQKLSTQSRGLLWGKGPADWCFWQKKLSQVSQLLWASSVFHGDLSSGVPNSVLTHIISIPGKAWRKGLQLTRSPQSYQSPPQDEVGGTDVPDDGGDNNWNLFKTLYQTESRCCLLSILACFMLQ